MTHEEQRIWLIEQLLAERSDASDVKIPADEQEQKNLLRGLMNIRMPEPISDEFLTVQDEYLTAENKAERPYLRIVMVRVAVITLYIEEETA